MGCRGHHSAPLEDYQETGQESYEPTAQDFYDQCGLDKAMGADQEDHPRAERNLPQYVDAAVDRDEHDLTMREDDFDVGYDSDITTMSTGDGNSGGTAASSQKAAPTRAYWGKPQHANSPARALIVSGIANPSIYLSSTTAARQKAWNNVVDVVRPIVREAYRDKVTVRSSSVKWHQLLMAHKQDYLRRRTQTGTASGSGGGALAYLAVCVFVHGSFLP